MDYEKYKRVRARIGQRRAWERRRAEYQAAHRERVAAFNEITITPVRRWKQRIKAEEVEYARR